LRAWPYWDRASSPKIEVGRTSAPRSSQVWLVPRTLAISLLYSSLERDFFAAGDWRARRRSFAF
jgi:hypothetical protein